MIARSAPIHPKKGAELLGIMSKNSFLSLSEEDPTRKTTILKIPIRQRNLLFSTKNKSDDLGILVL
jgi:hypothetical protein